MGLLDDQTQNTYYSGSSFGGYQFISLDDIINNFILSYTGEDNLIPSVNTNTVAFHAQRALQELSYDTFKSVKAQEITVPSSLTMVLPQDYVNYVKMAWSDSAGIEHVLYPATKTSNPTKITQDTDGDYMFTGGHNNRSIAFDGDGDYIDTNQVFRNVFSDSFTISFWMQADDGNPGSTSYIFGHENDSSGFPTAGLSMELKNDGKLKLYFEGNNDVAYWTTDAAVFANGASSWTHIAVTVERVGITSDPSVGTIYVNGAAVAATEGSSITSQAHSLYGNAAQLANFYIGGHNDAGAFSFPYAGKIDEFAIWATKLSASSISSIYNSGTYVDLLTNNNSYTQSAYLHLYYKMDSTTGTTVTDSSSYNISGSMNGNPQWDTSVPHEINTTDSSLATTDPSTTWENYKSSQPSENQDSYDDDYYVTMLGQRYGIDPVYSQTNGSFFIDENTGKIHFSSNISGKTVILKYISDSLGTDAEMQVHKLAEEAMYKWIAYGILSTRVGIPDNIIMRLRRDKIAETRKAKLRLSNIKLEEITQILRGKSKHIKH